MFVFSLCHIVFNVKRLSNVFQDKENR